VLRTYRNTHNLNTLTGIINRWAPPIENDTESYINHASRALGITANTPLQPQDYPQLMRVIIRHENGEQPYDDAAINAGFERGFYA